MAPKALSLDEQLTSTEPEGWTPGLPLLSHQVVARKWMADMESRPIRGGILNDVRFVYPALRQELTLWCRMYF